MHLAILMTNTDESAFAQNHPKDGEKFRDLIHSVRPDWRATSFPVKDGVFPTDISIFDGVMITGSPASVHDTDPWVAQLLELIGTLFTAQIPMFGACYGHQAIALALGGIVEANAGGWVFGATQSDVMHSAKWMGALPSPFVQYGAHVEAVTALPKGAEILTVSNDCAITGYCIGNRVYTTQNHPEMSAEFIAALVAEYESKLPEGVGKRAQASLSLEADTLAYAETIAQFFEQASTD